MKRQSNFATTVYRLLCRVPHGRVVTYLDLAIASGHPRASRVVGGILHNNPNPEKYPCFRVVNRFGGLAPEFAFGGLGAQAALLRADGIPVTDEKVDLSVYRYSFTAADRAANETQENGCGGN